MGEARTVNVRYTRRAFRQMNAVFDHIGDHSPQGAQTVKQRLQAAVDGLAANPQLGPRIGKHDLRREDDNPYPYLIFSRVARDAVVIHGVRHAARRPRR